VAPDGGVHHVEGSLEKLKKNYDSRIAKGIADAPFRKDWSLQMFKRALRDAVASGKEWIGWTTGETQAERFDLSKQVDYIDYRRVGPDKYDVSVVGKNGTDLFSETGINQSRVSDAVGKEIADKIAKGEGQSGGGRMTLRGLDLKVGGEGMKGFYDKILPSEVQKYVKQWGSEVKKNEVNTGQGKPTEYADFSEYQKARKEGQKTTIWRVDITPEMRKSVSESGQPRFMPAGDMATGRGVKDHREAMDLFEKGYRLYGALYDGMEDPIRLKKASEIERFDPENLWAVPSKKISAAISVRNMPADIQRDIGRNQDFANPPTDAEAVDALSSEKKAKFGAARSIKPGTQVAARIDIPAFLRTGKYVVAVHEPDGAAGGPGKVIGYDTVTRLQNPKFVVKPGVQRIYEGKSAKFPVATVDGKIMADRSIPGDLENYVPVGMDPKEHAYFYDKRTDQPVIGGSESVSVGNTVFVKNPVYGDPSQFAFMPSPDSAMPGAYSFPGGYRALPGKAKGSLRLYGPAGSLIGIAASLDEAQRIIRKKVKQ
jgi:hypothetical protein